MFYILGQMENSIERLRPVSNVLLLITLFDGSFCTENVGCK